MPSSSSSRAFKTARFSKDAKKAKIKDAELCLAIQQVLLGQVDDLGGGVFKKRLNNNLHRSIILAKGGKYWIYEYLFAKKDRANIENDELLAFRLLANSYAGLTELQVSQLLVNGDFVEICHDDKTEIQK
ncbi:MAG: type II toxin-antitoxin system RelE/ParE family toxin [Burkholderiales bacterium]|nr:type II toxin-antitoxin system RelE/ParE family toxin [Burkholderiales bacterium]MBK9347033.1 type II toxin-antitoxin system RelE/ParE family toxin [Burkholderiales bacterium]